MEAGVWAAWAGALVSAIGAGVVLWTRWRDRPEVTWHLGLDGIAADEAQRARLRRNGRDPYRVVRLTNVGDGSAYAVTVTGTSILDAQLFEINADDARGFSTFSVVGRVTPNEPVFILTWVASDEPSSDDAAVRVRWTEGPVRHSRHREQSFVLAGDLPGPHPPVRLSARTESGLAVVRPK